jgi:hypothetical protein
LPIDLEFRTPYLARVQSSNLASHVVRSMVQAATGNAITGALGNPSTKLIALVASDVNLAAFAGLFHLDWILPGYQANYSSPGGPSDNVHMITLSATGTWVEEQAANPALALGHNRAGVGLGVLPPKPAGLIVPKPAHNAKYWGRAMKGMDFTTEDRVDPADFNRILWKGMMGRKPSPAVPDGTDLRKNRAELLARYRRSLKTD